MSYRTLLAASIFAVSVCAQAADQQVEALLGHMRDAYKSVKSATFRTESTVYPKDEPSEDFSCDFAYRSPDLIRIVLKASGAKGGVVTEVSNGKKITISTSLGSPPEQDYSVENIEKGLPVNLESLSFWDFDRQLNTATGKNMAQSTFKIVKDEEWNGKHWIVLEETAKKDNVLCRYFIDPKTYFIWRTRVKDLTTNKDQMDAHFTKLNPDAGLTEDSFTGS
jgi:outer membrane lipoprotein-sorting protein